MRQKLQPLLILPPKLGVARSIRVRNAKTAKKLILAVVFLVSSSSTLSTLFCVSGIKWFCKGGTYGFPKTYKYLKDLNVCVSIYHRPEYQKIEKVMNDNQKLF